MSKALKCDRCKCCFDPYTVDAPDAFATLRELIYQDGRQFVDHEVGYRDEEINLCPDCANEFDRFMDGMKCIPLDVFNEYDTKKKAAEARKKEKELENGKENTEQFISELNNAVAAGLMLFDHVVYAIDQFQQSVREQPDKSKDKPAQRKGGAKKNSSR